MSASQSLPQTLAKPVQFLRGVGPKRAELLKHLGVHTLGELLEYFPRAWENRRETPAAPVQDSPVVLCGRVDHNNILRPNPSIALFVATLKVPNRAEPVEAVWFKRPSHRYDVFQTLKKDIAVGADVWIIGRAEPGLVGLRKVRVEEYYLLQDPRAGLHVGRIVPIYPLTEGLTPRFMRETVALALEAGGADLREILPMDLLERRELLALPQAVRGIHYPRSPQELEQSRRRMAYEEFLLLALAWTIKYRQTRAVSKGYGYKISRTLLTPFRDQLGFELTGAQKRVINEIFEDMQSQHPMTRLLQGDVGSGKTVVAVAALLLAVENGYQGAFMAPTEILAEQHHWTFSAFLQGLPVRFALLTSRIPEKRRKQTIAEIERGEADIIIGTHALLEGDVRFHRLRLAVIDEQHRFGVRQRTTLRAKGQPMDLLLMTATPIPRTLSLALYGDLDVSTLDEMPPGRQPPVTRWVPEAEALSSIRREVAMGRQAYVVYPIIEESALLDLKAAKAEFERLRGEIFAGLRVALVHGRMPAQKKIRTMEEFARGEWDILVATPVIEVGVDVPNASVMVVQNAERFGLASLHQLRGRIGRGSHSSHCFLVADPKTQEAQKRLSILCETSDGFRIGEEDLKIRGPGELLGTAQHGELALRVGDLSRDTDLLAAAQTDAKELLTLDSELAKAEHVALREKLTVQYQHTWHSIDLA